MLEDYISETKLSNPHKKYNPSFLNSPSGELFFIKETTQEGTKTHRSVTNSQIGRYIQPPEVITSELVHYIYYHFKEWSDLLKNIEEVVVAIQKKLGTDIDFDSIVDIFSLRETGPIATKLFFPTEKPYIQHLGFDSTFDFPFYTGGIKVFANETLLELMLREDKLYSASELRDLFFYIIHKTENITENVGGNYFFGELKPKGTYFEVHGSMEERFIPIKVGKYILDPQHYIFKEKNIEEIEKGQELIERAKMRPIKNSVHTVRKAVQTLDDLDVLRRLSNQRLSEGNNSQSRYALTKANALALFFLEQYLDLIPTASYYSMGAPSIMIEPQMAGDIPFYELAIQRFEGRTSQTYYRKYVDRAKVCLADLTNDKSLYLSTVPSLINTANEDRTIVSFSWAGKALAKTGRITEAESVFNEALSSYANKELPPPQEIAFLRSLKGMVDLGKNQYIPQLVEYTSKLIAKGILAEDQVKRI